MVAGLVGMGVGLFLTHDKFLDLHRQIKEQKEFHSLVASATFNEEVRKSLQLPQTTHDNLASQIRSTYPGAYKDLSDSELEEKFSAKVRRAEGAWEEYAASPHVKVRGPDNNLYLFPPGTTKDLAVAYFRKKWDNIRPIPGSTTSINAGNVKSVTWAENGSGISCIETQDGRTLYNKDAPSHWLYLLYASYLLLGFLVPWGAIRTIGWVLLGFQKE